MIQKPTSTPFRTPAIILHLATFILLLLGFAYSVSAAAQASVSAKPQNPSNISTRQYDASFAVTPKVVFYKFKYKKGIALIDIRSAEDYERLRIPGSMNIPLHFIKTKTYLKSTTIVLVHKGFGYSRMIAECRRLKTLGFETSILDGGLPAWHRKGGRLVGDLLALSEMKAITPQKFLPESTYRNVILVDISPDQIAGVAQMLPHAIHLPNFNHSPSSQNRFQQMIKARKNQPFQSILLFSNTGADYANILHTLDRKRIDVFYLRGGLAAYEQYLENLTLSRKPRESRTRTISNCKTCGENSDVKTFQPVK